MKMCRNDLQERVGSKFLPRTISMVFWMTFLSANAEPFCAEFVFDNSTIQNSVLNVKAHTKVNITFYLQNKSCNNLANVVITVSSWDKDISMYRPQCQIVQKENTCRQPPATAEVQCACLSKPLTFRLTTYIKEDDGTLWKWSSDKYVESVVISFNITVKEQMIQLDNKTSFVSFQTTEEVITTPKMTAITTENGSTIQRESWFRKGKRTTRQEGGSLTTGSTFPAPSFKVLSTIRDTIMMSDKDEIKLIAIFFYPLGAIVIIIFIIVIVMCVMLRKLLRKGMIQAAVTNSESSYEISMLGLAPRESPSPNPVLTISNAFSKPVLTETTFESERNDRYSYIEFCNNDQKQT